MFYVCACTYVRFYVIFHFVVVEVPIKYDSTKKCTLRPRSRVKAQQNRWGELLVDVFYETWQNDSIFWVKHLCRYKILSPKWAGKNLGERMNYY